MRGALTHTKEKKLLHVVSTTILFYVKMKARLGNHAKHYVQILPPHHLQYHGAIYHGKKLEVFLKIDTISP